MSGLTPPITQPTAPSDIAQWVMTQTQNTLNDAVTGPMQALFEALMPVIVVGLTLQFVVYAFALMHGQGGMTVTEFFRKAIMVAIISIFFGAGGLYQADIAQTMIALPDDVTQIALGTGSVAEEVDKLQTETSKASNTMIGKGGNGAWYNVLPSTKEVLVSILATLVRINAAVVGILAAALYDPVWTNSVLSPPDFALALAGFLLLSVWKVQPWIVVLALAAGGMLLHLL